MHISFLCHQYSLSGTSRSASTSIIRRTARSAPAVTATARPSAPAVSVVVSRVTRRVTLFRFHLTGSCGNYNKLYIQHKRFQNTHAHTRPFIVRKSRRTLSVSLSKLNLDLPSTDPLSVQVMQGVFCVSHVLEPARLLRLCFWNRHWLLVKTKHGTPTLIDDSKENIWGYSDDRQEGKLRLMNHSEMMRELEKKDIYRVESDRGVHKSWIAKLPLITARNHVLL